MAIEPAPGSTVVSSRGHTWKSDLDGKWWGCYKCDPDDVCQWNWVVISWDTEDDLPLEISPATTDWTTETT